MSACDRKFCQLWLSWSQDRTFTDITGGESQTKWQSFLILPSHIILVSLSLLLFFTALFPLHTPVSFCFLLIYLKAKKTLFPALSFCLRMLSSIQCCNTLTPSPILGFSQDVLQWSGRGWWCPCTASWAAHFWYQQDPAVCTKKLLLSCCAYEIIRQNTVNKSCLSLSLFCI